MVTTDGTYWDGNEFRFATVQEASAHARRRPAARAKPGAPSIRAGGSAPGSRRRVRPGRYVWCVRQGTFSILVVASGSSPRPGTNEFRSGLVDW